MVRGRLLFLSHCERQLTKEEKVSEGGGGRGWRASWCVGGGGGGGGGGGVYVCVSPHPRNITSDIHFSLFH